MKQKLLSHFVLLIIAAFYFAGCSSSTSPNTPSSTVTQPGVGSTFIYHETSVDSVGNTTNDSYDTSYIAQTNVNIGGRTDAIEMITGGLQPDTSYYAISASGDYFIYSNFGAGGSWLSVPFSSGSTSTSTPIDQDISDSLSGLTYHLKVVATTTPTGTETLSVGGTSYSTKKVTVQLDIKVTMLGQVSESVLSENLWFSPEIGNMVKSVSLPSTDAATGETSDTQTELLTSFTLK